MSIVQRAASARLNEFLKASSSPIKEFLKASSNPIKEFLKAAGVDNCLQILSNTTYIRHFGMYIAFIHYIYCTVYTL
jgi:hypothetical protein